MKKHIKDYFIPHDGNDYKPHSLQKVAMIAMVGLILLSFTLANVQSLVWISSQWMVSAILPAVIVDSTNNARKENSLGILRRNEALDNAAQLKADDMSRYSYFEHTSPTGVTPWYWFGEASYNFVNAGENLAVHFIDSGDLMDAWLESPSHRANIMNKSYTEIGIGVSEGVYEGFSTIYVVQFFGTPAASPSVAGASISNDVTQTPVDVQQNISVQSEVLAEAVKISETVEFIEADPVPKETSIKTQQDNKLQNYIPATSSLNTEVIDIKVTDTGVSMYSDLVSTSTGGIPAILSPDESNTVSTAPFLLDLVTQPHIVLQTLYILLGLFVFGILLLSILIEVRKQDVVQIVYGVSLLVLMYGLFQIHIYLSSGALIV